jgi:hypothetical protein
MSFLTSPKGFIFYLNTLRDKENGVKPMKNRGQNRPYLVRLDSQFT